MSWKSSFVYTAIFSTVGRVLRNLQTNVECYAQYFVKYLWWKLHTLPSTVTCFFNTSNYGFWLCALCLRSKGKGIHFRGWVTVASQQDVVRLPVSWSQRCQVKKLCRSIYTKISHLKSESSDTEVSDSLDIRALSWSSYMLLLNIWPCTCPQFKVFLQRQTEKKQN